MRGRLLVGCAGLALLAGCAREPAAPPRPNVLLVVVDTLRADALGVYGSPHGDSPRLDAFAEDAFVFERASTPRAKTNPAVASLFTGSYPALHGVRDLGRRLPDELPTLAERFRDAGWTTGAIVGNYVLGRERSGLARGFEHWDESLPDPADARDPARGTPERRARSLTDGALAFLDAVDGPFLLYLHYMDPHGPYDPPSEHRVEPGAPEPIVLPDDPPRWRTPRIAEHGVPEEARRADGTVDAAVVRAQYRGEVRSVDAELGRLFDGLAARGLAEGTIVVVTADHGESLGEHDYWFEHGLHAYEATCRVPLLVRAPGTAATPDLGSPASLVDVGPTLLALLGLPPLHERGLGPPLDLLAPRPPSPTYSEKAEGNDVPRTMQIDAVRVGRWKLVRRFTTLEDGTRRILADELYDLAADPLERDDRIERPGGAPLDALRGALAEWRAYDDRWPDAPRREPDAAELDRLRAMGYLGR